MSVEQAWKSVAAEAGRLKPIHLRTLFAEDSERFARFSLQLGDLTVDFSKEKIDAAGVAALLTLAEAAGVEPMRDAMFAGEPINLTEGRAVLHTALRAPRDAATESEGRPVAGDIHAVLDRLCAFAEDLRSGAYAPPAGGRFTDVVNIGIGGSDLGPAMAVRALAPFATGPRVHFVANVDGADLTDTVRTLDPATTLFIIASKTFTTLETMTNARSARAWLEQALAPEHVGGHLAAVSTNLKATAEFGIDDSRVFGFWDWVGGRYSVWSAIGLSVAIAVGASNFRAFLDGARAMDDHFRTAPLAENLPVVLALIGLWRRNALEYPTVALIPYDQRLARLPAYVQQLDMESNGKRVTRDGRGVGTATGPVIWGEPGTNAQHSFFQLIHQGTDVIPVDFIVAAQPHEDVGDHHAMLLANCLAQSEALAFGKTEQEVRAEMKTSGTPDDRIEALAAHRTFPGDRPSTTILHRRLDPFALGRLIALYEHKVFVQGVVWNVNTYDQWGVELGKQLAGELLPMVKGTKPAEAKDSSTRGLIARIAAL